MAAMYNCLANSSPKVLGLKHGRVVGINKSASLVIKSCTDSTAIGEISRKSFPPGFVFGTATSAYQVEGAARDGGRGDSIWDTFTRDFPGKIADRSSGKVACDSYNQYEKDVWFINDMGFDAYRFSISWSRVIPSGKLKDGVNEKGIEYYNNLINELNANNIVPYATLFHWDLPQGLENEYKGFLDSKIIEDFADFADLCFKRFGDRVKHWITINEPSTYTIHGYVLGIFAPNRCSPLRDARCVGGDCSTEPYIVSHNMLLAHARAVNIYRETYQARQRGEIGITLVSYWMVPYSDTSDDERAANRALDFMLGWYLHPLTHGNYPDSFESHVGDRMQKFREEESESLKGSFDFIGLNYYTTKYVAHMGSLDTTTIHPSYSTDSRAILHHERDNHAIGAQSGSDWLYSYPRGIKDLLLHVKDKYNNPLVYITENGVSERNNADKLSLEEQLNDTMRIEYYKDHLFYVKQAINHGATVKGYFAWSLLDNFEWQAGYTERFGLIYVDFKDGLKRYPKSSAYFFKKFLEK